VLTPVLTPALTPVLTQEQVAATAATIVAMREPDGAIPWSPGEHADVWNHLESAMALLAAGRTADAERAVDWALERQRPDGSWPMRWVAGRVEDASGETNMSAYLAVAVWHHWLLRRDAAYVRRCWPFVRRALDWVVSVQLPFGGLAWAQEWTDGGPGKVNREALLAGSSSIYQSLRAGVSLADLLGDPQPGWELAGGRLRHALRAHRDLFMDKSEYSMDWYYPILGGAVGGEEAQTLLAERWEEFVVPGLGIRCTNTRPWVTGAETCELVLALEAMGDQARARRLFADMQHLRADDGSYWTGYVWPDDAHWPGDRSTYTAAAVILAADALSDTTPGADLMRGRTMVAHFEPLGLECGCDPAAPSADRIARRPRHPA